MKKILFLISTFFLSILAVKAANIPNNIYYINDGLYAYLENDSIELTDNQKLFIEYRINDESLDLIEVKPNQKTIFLADSASFDALIDSRFVIFETDYTYLDWSEKEKITKFDFLDKPKIKIDNLSFKDDVSYDILNKDEIEEYFLNYKKIYDIEVTYHEEYMVNGKWENSKPDDLSDIKLDFRVYYEIDSIKSDYSNILTYENHPATCMFDSSFCCNQVFGISVCIWILIVSILLVLFLIIIDRKYHLKKEA